MYRVKRGVTLFISPEIEKILQSVCHVYSFFNLPVVVTSGVDGPHRENSLHYSFRAIDIRKNFRNPVDIASWTMHRETILDGLENTFQRNKFPVLIVEEYDHIHLEWCSE